MHPSRISFISHPPTLHLRFDRTTIEGVEDAMNLLQAKNNNALAMRFMTRASALDQMEHYLSRVGLDLSKDMQFVHIAGSKGKGSTSAFVENILHSHGYSTGLYTSPHLISLEERFRINSQTIEKHKFIKYFWEVWDKLHATLPDNTNTYNHHLDIVENVMPFTNNNQSGVTSHIPPLPSYFAMLTLVGFYLYKQEGVDVVVCEVGLGGKLDSTNVIPHPLVTAITTLSLEHIEILGNSLPLIAHEKCGIFKPNAPIVTFPQHPDAWAVILKEAAKCQQIPILINDLTMYTDIELGIDGDYQKRNANMASIISAIAIQELHNRGVQPSLLSKMQQLHTVAEMKDYLLQSFNIPSNNNLHSNYVQTINVSKQNTIISTLNHISELQIHQRTPAHNNHHGVALQDKHFLDLTMTSLQWANAVVDKINDYYQRVNLLHSHMKPPIKFNIDKSQISHNDFTLMAYNTTLDYPTFHITALTLPLVVGLSTTWLRGRCEAITTLDQPDLVWCIDGAHTPESITSSAKWYRQQIEKDSRRTMKYRPPSVTVNELSSLNTTPNDLDQSILVFNCGHVRSPFTLLQPIVESLTHNYITNQNNLPYETLDNLFDHVFIAPFDLDKPHPLPYPTLESLFQQYNAGNPFDASNGRFDLLNEPLLSDITEIKALADIFTKHTISEYNHSISTMPTYRDSINCGKTLNWQFTTLLVWDYLLQHTLKKFHSSLRTTKSSFELLHSFHKHHNINNFTDKGKAHSFYHSSYLSIPLLPGNDNLFPYHHIQKDLIEIINIHNTHTFDLQQYGITHKNNLAMQQAYHLDIAQYSTPIQFHPPISTLTRTWELADFSPTTTRPLKKTQYHIMPAVKDTIDAIKFIHNNTNHNILHSTSQTDFNRKSVLPRKKTKVYVTGSLYLSGNCIKHLNQSITNHNHNKRQYHSLFGSRMKK